MADDRQRAPRFYLVPSGTKKSTCRSNQCQGDIYFIDSEKTPGKKIPIDCSVVGGRVPTELETGSGIIHHIVCADADRFREKRPPARRPQRELEVDHKPPACIFCGCTQTRACRYVPGAEEVRERADHADIPGGEALPTGDVSCYWLQLDPPICSNPKCVEQRKDLPLRMRLPKAAGAKA